MLLPQYTHFAARLIPYLDSARLDEVHLPCHLTRSHDKVVFEVHLQEVGNAVRSRSSDFSKPLLHVATLHQDAESIGCMMSSQIAAVPSHNPADARQQG